MHPRRTSRSFAIAGIVAVLVAGAAPVSAAAPAPTGSWVFNGNYQNRAGTALQMTGINAPTFNEVRVRGTRRNALIIASDQGALLTNIPLKARRTFTIDIFLEFDDMSGYQRILSFGPNDKDEGLYLYDGHAYLYDEKEDEDITVPANRFAHVRVTREESTNAMRVYVDGVTAFSYKDIDAQFVLRQGMVVFFQDDSHGSENGVGTIAAIKVWNKVVAP